MPFDGAEREFDERLQLLTRMSAALERVSRLLASEERWCKGTLSTPDGRYCILGAMNAAGTGRLLELVVLGAIRDVTGQRYARIDLFNDARSTTHAQVITVLGRARENVQRGLPLGEPVRLLPSRDHLLRCAAVVKRGFGACLSRFKTS